MSFCPFTWETDQPDLAEYLAALTAILGEIRGKAVILDPKDFAYGQNLHMKGVPIHVVYRAVLEVERKWMEAHPLFDRVNACGITKLRYCRKVIEQEFQQHLISAAGAF